LSSLADKKKKKYFRKSDIITKADFPSNATHAMDATQ